MTALQELIADGTLDSELGALVWLMAEHGVPVSVVAPRSEAAERVRMAVARAVRSEQPARDSVAGGVILGRALEDVLRLLGAGPAAGAASGELVDDARDMGIVLVLDEAGRVIVAHYVRPIERDGAGHLQRRPPAVLAARPGGEPAAELDHFWWAYTDELATRAQIERAVLETEHEARRQRLSGADSVLGPPDARH